MRTPSLVGLGILFAVSAFAQQRGELRARELFYTPVPDAKPKPAAEAKPVAKTEPKPTPRRETRVNPGSQGVPGTMQANQNEPVKMPDGARLENTAAGKGDTAGPPLALKYRLLKRSSDGAYDEVDTDTVFRSGDAIRVSVEANDGAYLYVVQRGSSGTWSPLFPNEDTDNGSNHVERNREYEIPNGGRFTFTGQPGTERIFIVLTRRPEADLEKLIYSLSGGGKAAEPASTEPKDKASKLLVAQNRIDDSVIDKLRGRVLARDLVFEKVNDEKPVTTSSGRRKEKAMYIATPDRSLKARVVADLTLNHQ